MSHINQNSLPVRPRAHSSAIVGGTSHYRFTVLTPGLLRYEWSPDNKFEDRPSVFAINRELPVPEFRVKEKVDELEIITSQIHLTYDKQDFSPSGLSVVVKGFYGCHASVWRFGEDCENLGGTARTLDEADGRIPLAPGVISRKGYTSIDDSESMLFDEDGFVAGRMPGVRVDGYLFAYGHDYREAVKALYALSGNQPLLPRWALGNWWSRYYAYHADEYLALMDRFRDEGIPLSVAVLDMDWHIVDDQRVTAAGKTGWTGYTWNKKLFPDPTKFLAELHKRKLKVSLNDHPADGVQAYEDLYPAMAKALNHDTSANDPIHFDITKRKFMNAFFDVLHRPLENQGVDLWWIDWQQGSYSRIPGVDPLWMLNHYHFLDSARGHKRPLTFSRYAGPGSHRYPVGFSGDTIVTWASLAFQPEFTATASNIGYGWWSHDIGGHMFGGKDDELGTRWVQLGVFSPILRLHSMNNQWALKEPWMFGRDARVVMTEFLRFRHRLMPYLYTMNARAAIEGSPLVQPMYWEYPEREEAYRVPNQYLFGSELLVVPITEPQNPKLRLARVKGWLPPGRWVDIFSGATYDGDREVWLSRSLETYPVFAKEGSIIPLDAASEPENGGDNPSAYEILVVAGADGKFELLEDDEKGSTADEVNWVRTVLEYTHATGTLSITPPTSVAAAREWNVRFLGLDAPASIKVQIGNKTPSDVAPKVVPNGFLVELGADNFVITVQLGKKNSQLRITDAEKFIQPLLSEAQIEFGLKEQIWQIVQGLKKGKTVTTVVSALCAVDMKGNEGLLDAVLEAVLADGREGGKQRD